MEANADDPVVTDGDERRARRLGARHLWLCGLAIALVAGVATVVHLGSDQPIRVATAGAGETATSTSTAPDPTVTTTAPGGAIIPEETPTTAISTSTTLAATTSTAKPRSTTTTTTTPPGTAAVVTTAPQQLDGYQTVLPAGGVMFPYEAGRNRWEATSNGFVIRVQVDDPAPRGGQVVHYTIDVSGAGTCCQAVIGYDGTFTDQVGRGGSTCPSVPGNTYAASFVYNTAGLVRFNVLGGNCSSPAAGWLSGWLQVSEGQSSVQGPALPTLKLTNYASPDHPGDYHYLPLFIGAQDADGWIRQFVVDWGDGTAPTTYAYNPFRCRAWAPNAWPEGNYVSLPSDTTHPLVGLDGQPAPSTEHFYSAPGTYTVTVTARSTACDGSQPQAGTGTMTWTVN